MTIPTGSPVDYFGTATTVTASGATAAVASGIYSVLADSEEWTNSDDVIMAAFIGRFTFSIIPTSIGSIALYARPMLIDGINDAQEPSDNYPDVYLGSFPINLVTSLQAVPLEVSLTNLRSSQAYRFYIKNNVNMPLDAAWEMEITPKAIAGKV